MEQSWKAKFSGVFTDLVTPFKDGKLDMYALERYLERQLDVGVHGLVPLDTTGEADRLTEAETADIIRVAIAGAKGRAIVLAAIGSNDTARAIAKAKHAADEGVDGLLVATRHDTKASQDGLFEHFSAVASAVELPVMLNNVRRPPGAEVLPETVARLVARYPNIVGVKQAGGKIERVTEFRHKCGDDFVIHCGDDNLALAFYAMGANGLISIASNLVAREFVELYAAWRQGDIDRALKLHESVFDLVEVLLLEGNSVAVKAALASCGLMEVDVRHPLAPLSSQSRSALLRRLEPHAEGGRLTV